MDERARLELDERGYALVASIVDAEGIARFRGRAADAALFPGARQRHGATFAVRGMLFSDPSLAELMDEVGITRMASVALGDTAYPIDAMLFDKIPESNWKVPGHQDVVMPVASGATEPGFTSFSVQGGVTYARLPTSVLEGLIAARIHLDDTDAENGALAVVPGSHKKELGDIALGKLSRSDYVVCEARKGDVFWMRPLLVHRSAPAKEALHRRVLHVVYACAEPGVTVRWRRGVPS